MVMTGLRDDDREVEIGSNCPSPGPSDSGL